MRLPWRSRQAEIDHRLRKLTLQHAERVGEALEQEAKEKKKKKEEEEAKTLEWLRGQAALGEKEKKPRTGKAGVRKRKYPRTGKEGATKR